VAGNHHRGGRTKPPGSYPADPGRVAVIDITTPTSQIPFRTLIALIISVPKSREPPHNKLVIWPSVAAPIAICRRHQLSIHASGQWYDLAVEGFRKI
jgi:hypothetical protein